MANVRLTGGPIQKSLERPPQVVKPRQFQSTNVSQFQLIVNVMGAPVALPDHSPLASGRHRFVFPSFTIPMMAASAHEAAPPLNDHTTLAGPGSASVICSPVKPP